MNSSIYPKFEKIIKGQVTYQTEVLGLNLLISRLKKSYSSQPNQVQLNSAVKEMDAFFDKYSSILTKDIDKLSKI